MQVLFTKANRLKPDVFSSFRPSPISAPRSGQRSPITKYYRYDNHHAWNYHTITYNILIHLKHPYGTSMRSFKKANNLLTEHMNVSLRDGVETSTWQQDDMRFSVLRHFSCDRLWFFTYVSSVEAFCCVVSAQQKARFIGLRQSGWASLTVSCSCACARPEETAHDDSNLPSNTLFTSGFI